VRLETHEIVELIRSRGREIAGWDTHMFSPEESRGAFLQMAARIIELANAIPENSK